MEGDLPTVLFSVLSAVKGLVKLRTVTNARSTRLQLLQSFISVILISLIFHGDNV